MLHFTGNTGLNKIKAILISTSPTTQDSQFFVIQQSTFGKTQKTEIRTKVVIYLFFTGILEPHTLILLFPSDTLPMKLWKIMKVCSKGERTEKANFNNAASEWNSIFDRKEIYFSQVLWNIIEYTHIETWNTKKNAIFACFGRRFPP